jgi:hypothetical protein
MLVASHGIKFVVYCTDEGIDSISVTPDSALSTIYNLQK